MDIVKKALLPTELFTMRATVSLFNRANSLLMGHNRWATKGRINGVNAHPFEFENIVGAHNGTLVNQRLLANHEEFEVDSENLIYSIQKFGIKETYKLLHGAAALVWYDSDTYNINFARNKERPMFITYAEDRKTIFWASESWMLEGVLAKNGIKHSDIFDTAIDKHYCFHIPQYTDNVANGQIKGTFGKVKIEDLVPYEVPPIKKSQTKNTIVTYIGRDNQSFGKGTTPKQSSKGFTNNSDVTKGTGYKMGDEISFYFDYDTPPDKKFVMAFNSMSHDKKIRVYIGRSSWLRACYDGKSEKLYSGKCNGYFFDDKSGEGCLVQGNSCMEIAENDIDYFDDDDFTNDIAKDPVHIAIQKVIDNCGGVCSICSDPLISDKSHIVVNDNVIICRHCKDTDFAKDVIDNY